MAVATMPTGPTPKPTLICDRCGIDLRTPAEICGFCIDELRIQEGGEPAWEMAA